MRYRTVRDITLTAWANQGPNAACRFTLPAGSAVKRVEGDGGGFAVESVPLLIALTGNSHDPHYRYVWVDESEVEPVPAEEGA